MDSFLTILTTLATAAAVIVPGYFVMRAALRKEQTAEQQLDAADRQAQAARLDDVDAKLWGRLLAKLAERDDEMTAVRGRVTALENDLESEREARRALAAASKVIQDEFERRIAELQTALDSALAEVAALRTENDELRERLRSQERRKL
jgi:hypothetical protein